jgi:hypothetical protein
VGWLAGLDPAQGDGGGQRAGQAQAGLLLAVAVQRLDGEEVSANLGSDGLSR